MSAVSQLDAAFPTQGVYTQNTGALHIDVKPFVYGHSPESSSSNDAHTSSSHTTVEENDHADEDIDVISGDEHTDSGNSSAPSPIEENETKPISQIKAETELSVDTQQTPTISQEAKFNSFKEFEYAFDLWKAVYHHPFRTASSETLREPDGHVNEKFKYRYIVFHCAHYGQPRMRGVGKRPNQNYLPCGCKAMLRLNYNFNEKVLKVTTLHEEHTGHDLNEGPVAKKAKRSPEAVSPAPTPKHKKEEMKQSPASSTKSTATSNSTATSSAAPMTPQSLPPLPSLPSVGTSLTPLSSLSNFPSANLAAFMGSQNLAAMLVQQQKENLLLPPPTTASIPTPSYLNSPAPQRPFVNTTNLLQNAYQQNALMSTMLSLQHQYAMMQQPTHGLMAPLIPPPAEPTPTSMGGSIENTQLSSDPIVETKPLIIAPETNLENMHLPTIVAPQPILRPKPALYADFDITDRKGEVRKTLNLLSEVLEATEGPALQQKLGFLYNLYHSWKTEVIPK
ncbi:unnamed protein product, partial [Mesorhabditis spiculigera]